MRHDFIDRYSRVPTLVSAVDPRVRILSALAILLTVVMAPPNRPGIMVVCAVPLAVYATIAGVPLGWLMARAAVVLPFALVAGAWIPFAGPEAGGWGALAHLVGRALVSAATLVLLASTTRFPLLLRGMEGLGLPRVLTTILSFTYRFLFVLVGEAERLEIAVRSRAPRARGRFRALARSVGYLFLRTYERAERVYQAMLARGFRGEVPAGEPLSISGGDVFVLGAAVFFVALAWVVG